jgi:hypothetical protein
MSEASNRIHLSVKPTLDTNQQLTNPDGIVVG